MGIIWNHFHLGYTSITVNLVLKIMPPMSNKVYNLFHTSPTSVTLNVNFEHAF